jgi:hypothetical protein
MEQIINAKLEYLNSMFNKYSELNKKTKGRYMYRQQAIASEIEAIVDILNNVPNNTWDKCYEEDLKDSNS